MELRIQYTTTTDGVSIAWSEAGEGPAVLHCQATPFSHVQESFAINAAYADLARSCRFIMFDARGTGMSERNVLDVSTDTLLIDARAVVDAANFDHFVVIADMNLLALWTALHLATELPGRVTHLILESPIQNMAELADTPYGRTAGALAEADWAVYTKTLMRVLGGWDVEGAWIEATVAAVAGWVDPTLGLQYTKLAGTVDVGNLLANVVQPTLVLRNEPTFIPAQSSQRIAARIPGAQFRQYSDPNYVQWAGLIRAFAELPSPSPVQDGRVASTFRTMLFTDMVDHTEMMSRLGDERGRDVLREHERITRELLKTHGGSEIKTDGDSFMVSFTSVISAVECAVALQRAFSAYNKTAPEPIAVRMGLNAGEPIEEEGDLFGATVILASRIAAKAAGGEILVADTVRGLCAGKGFLFSDRGDFVAKGFDEAVRVYEVSWRADSTS
jgi:class 3 adenylate cyclase/pimeloyl-ACP methyl ester carboxylesterase